MSNVLVISTSLRAKSNSDILAEKLTAGAKDARHTVEHISLKGMELKFCVGCLVCQKTQKCVLHDDAVRIAEKVRDADTLVFVTPIYYYEMSGQMKTLLDRMNPLYPSDYRFRKVYMLSETGRRVLRACRKRSEGLGRLFRKSGIQRLSVLRRDLGSREAYGRNEALNEAYEFGKTLE